MSRARVIPAVGAFLAGAVETLEYFDFQRRLELLEKDGQCGAHDAGTDEDHVRIRYGPICHHQFSSVMSWN